MFADASRAQRHVMHIGTKADRLPGSSSLMGVLAVSASTGVGLSELCDRLADALAVDSRGQRQLLGMTASRCQESLQAARDALSRTAEAVTLGLGDDLIAIELREVLEHLGHIVGAVYTDDVLDRIFSKFCIGK